MVEQQPRDPETGKFLPKGAEEDSTEPEEVAVEESSDDDEEPSRDQEDTSEADEPDDGTIVLDLDEDLEAVLAKYDNDIGKALRSLAEGQSFIGRQGNEIGELKAQIQEMRDLLAQNQQQVQQPQPPPQFYRPYAHDIDENPQGLVFEAMERGDGQTLHQALKAWGEIEPFEAAMFAVNLERQLAEAEAQTYRESESPAQPGPNDLEAAMADVVSRHPDVEKYLPGLGEVAKEFPTLRGLMEHGNPSEKAGAFEDLLKIAKSREYAGNSRESAKRVILRAKEEVDAEKAQAQVVSAQRQSASKADSREGRIQTFYDAFDDAAGRYLQSDWLDNKED